MAVPDLAQQRQKFFESRRADLQRQGNAQTQEAQDAIQRRMTAIGQSASGAAMAAQNKAREGIMAQTQAAQNELAGQELQAMEPEAQRQFAMAEAEKQRGFEAGQAQLGRDFQGGMAEKDMNFKRGLFDIEQGNKLRELDMADRQFALDKETTEFNRRMAEIEAGRKDPGLFGGGGFLGTGIETGSLKRGAVAGAINPALALPAVAAPLVNQFKKKLRF